MSKTTKFVRGGYKIPQSHFSENQDYQQPGQQYINTNASAPLEEKKHWFWGVVGNVAKVIFPGTPLGVVSQNFAAQQNREAQVREREETQLVNTASVTAVGTGALTFFALKNQWLLFPWIPVVNTIGAVFGLLSGNPLWWREPAIKVCELSGGKIVKGSVQKGLAITIAEPALAIFLGFSVAILMFLVLRLRAVLKAHGDVHEAKRLRAIATDLNRSGQTRDGRDIYEMHIDEDLDDDLEDLGTKYPINQYKKGDKVDRKGGARDD